MKRALISSTLALLIAWGTAGADPLRVGTATMPLLMGNPYNAVSLPQTLPTHMIFDSLTLVGPNGTAKPDIFASWTQSADTVWRFTLTPGLVFSNGEALNADAVVEALTYLSTPTGRRDSSASMDMQAAIAKVTAIDAQTVEIVTKTPDPILPLHLSFVRIPPPAYWRKVGRDVFLRQPIGSGPYRVTSWDANRVQLVPNPSARRKPQLDGIEIIEIPDPAARLQALTSGAIDIAIEIGVQDKEAIQSIGGTLRPRRAPNVNFMIFVTTRDTPLKHVLVRQALNHAVNKEQMIAAFLDGTTTPATQGSHAGAFGFDPTLTPYAYDPARARALLKEAGFAKGFAMTVLVDPAVSGYADVYQQIAQDLAAVGVKLTIQPTTTTRIAESVQTGQWTADAFGWTFSGFDSLRGYLFRSCRWHHPYHCDTELMPLIEAAERAVTVDDRKRATQAALAFERDRPPALLLWQGVKFEGLAPHVTGFKTEEDYIAWEDVRMTR